MSSNILVTGGAGYIGSVVVTELLARGYGVVVLDDLSRGHQKAVASGATFVRGGVGDRVVVDQVLTRHRCDALVHLAAYALVGESVAEPELYRANNVTAGRTLLEAVARVVVDQVLTRHRCDALVHLAAYALVGESVAEPELYRANNVTAGRTLLEAVARAGVRRIVFSSTCSVYGLPRTVPIPEDAPLAPVNPYGESKREFERMLGEYAARDGGTVVSLRYFNAAGASAEHGEDHEPETHLIPNVLRVASGQRPALDVLGTDYPTPDGTAVRDYIHILDIADAHVRALEADLTGMTAMNLGTGVGYSVLAVAEAARQAPGQVRLQ